MLLSVPITLDLRFQGCTAILRQSQQLLSYGLQNKLTDLCFAKCLGPALICGDFSKGLGAAVAAKATADLAGLLATDEVSPPDPEALFEATEVVVSRTEGHLQSVKLQLCEWYAVEAIKRKLVAVRRYKKEKREEITDLIWAWVKAYTLKDLEKRRGELMKALYKDEQEYLCKNCQPKEL